MKKNALISVHDKNEYLLKFVKFIIDVGGYEIISTNGTCKYLLNHGFSNIKNVSDFISFSEILDGRIKTIHPYIYSSVLANRSIDEHNEFLKKKKINFIDIVVINFYPFSKKIKEKHDINSMIDFIDIGGPSILRAAAKNFLYVTPIVDYKDYKLVMDEIKKNGKTSLELRKKLAGKVFHLTSFYDSIISQFFSKKEIFPKYLNLSFEKKMKLRYGENPHQKSSFYINSFHKGSMSNFKQLHGKKLSFNNLKDIDTGWKIISQFINPTCCIIKHSTPCSVSTGNNIIDAFQKAYLSDPTSSFGGVFVFNMKVSKELSKKISKIFLEVIIANDYDQNAIDILKKKKNLRIIKMIYPISNTIDYVQLNGGLLLQENDYTLDDENFYIVTKRIFSKEEKESLIFAQKVVKYVKSNAIVVASGTQTLGISGGQTNRIWAAKEAIKRALKIKKNKLVLVSDAFFPFRDIIDEVANSKCISAILQPGGSIRDDESIEACNCYGIAMAFTGKRYFKH